MKAFLSPSSPQQSQLSGYLQFGPRRTSSQKAKKILNDTSIQVVTRWQLEEPTNIESRHALASLQPLTTLQQNLNDSCEDDEA
jgi:predicted DNA-binding ArsR family transcriptional regulator